MKEIKNYGHSVKSKLLNISHETGLSYQLLIVRYLQERLLYRLSISKYRDNFFLKGGALLYAYERFDARPTVDIDFLGNSLSRDIEHVKNVFAEISQIACEGDGVIFDATIDAQEISLNKQYNGVRLHITSHIDTIEQVISMDIGFGDVVTPEAQLLEYPLLVESLPSVVIRAYSLETVVAEKFQAMVELGANNSRMKDFFDVYRILANYNIDDDMLQQAINATFKNRHTTVSDGIPLFQPAFADDVMRNRFWEGYLRKIKWNEKIEFKEVWSFIMDRLKDFVLL